MTDEEYRNYRDERKSLITAEREEAKQFDKSILTLASGSFGLSLLFIRQIAPYPESRTLWLLFVAWGGFGLSILSTLVSLLLSQEALSRQRKIIDEIYKANTKKGIDTDNPYAIWTKMLNWGSICLFIAGVCFLTIFSVANF